MPETSFPTQIHISPPYTFTTAATLWWIDFDKVLPRCALTRDYNVVTRDSDVVTRAFDVITRKF